MKLIKNFLLFIINSLIQLVEKIEYRHLDLDQNDINKKILKSFDLNNVWVESDTGPVRASHLHITQPYQIWEITLKNGLKIECADNHIFFTHNLKEIYAHELKQHMVIATKYGPQKVVKVKRKIHSLSMGDLTIDSPEHRFYTNDILSHNTVTAAITILHYVTFNNKKNVLLMANKRDTAIEILDKLKSIYMLLPFFMKTGVTKWNEASVAFSNKCVVRTSPATKTPAIGFTIDFLYLDEFAHISPAIIEPYYRSVYPTVSSMTNSKIVITSTPNGFNKFHELFSKAEEGHNSYKPMKVYWYQVPGRHVTYLELIQSKLDKWNIEPEELENWLIDLYGNEEDANGLKQVELRWVSGDDEGWRIDVQNTDEITVGKIRELRYNKNGNDIPIIDLANVATWKEKSIEDIGGLDNFNQEYNIQFISGARSVFESDVLKKVRERRIEYEYREIDVLTDRLVWNYSGLLWHPEYVFRRDRPMFFSLDLAEGLGQDYSVINMFELKEKPLDLVYKQKNSYRNMYDFFYLDQIGIYRSNIEKVEEVTELLYLLGWELYDEDMVKIVLELNGPGETLLKLMPHVFDGNNNYGSASFIRYKHRIDSTKYKPGLKVRWKEKMIKDYQTKINREEIYITHDSTIEEMTKFIRIDSGRGNAQYRAETGHDDTVDTIVNLTTAWDTVAFKEACEDVWGKLSEHYRSEANEILDENPFQQGNDYNSFSAIRNKILNKNNNPWF